MPIVTYLWLLAPLVFLSVLVAYALRRASRRQEYLEAARFRGRTSEAGLASAMTDALTRMRGQELAQQARLEALEGFLHQVVESLPHGLFVLGRDGNLRVANGEALRWLGLHESVEGQVLWTLDGTESLRAVAQECLRVAAPVRGGKVLEAPAEHRRIEFLGRRDVAGLEVRPANLAFGEPRAHGHGNPSERLVRVRRSRSFNLARGAGPDNRAPAPGSGSGMDRQQKTRRPHPCGSGRRA